jgi:hypothetical protein
MYIVLPTTMGAASCPLLTASEKVKTGCNFFAVVGEISVSDEKRVAA